MQCKLPIQLLIGFMGLVLGMSMFSAKAEQQPSTATPSAATIPTIELGGTVSGLFSAQNTVYRYQLAIQQNHKIALTLQSPTLDIDLAFYGLSTNPLDFGLVFKGLHIRGGRAARLVLMLPANGLYLIVITPTKHGSGKFALSIGLDSEVSSSDNTVPTIDLSGQVATLISRLQKSGLVPDGGKQIFSLPIGFGTTSDPGYSLLTIGRGLNVGDMVLSYQVGWTSAGATSGCGFMFRAADGSNFSMVLLRQDGQLALIQRQGDNNSVDYERSSESFKPGSFTTITLIALGDKVSLYLNGRLETTQKVEPTKGGFAINVYNPADNTVVTDCRFRNIWVWSFDL